MFGKAKITKSPFDLSSYKLNKGFETVFEGAEHLIPASKDQPQGLTIKATHIVG